MGVEAVTPPTPKAPPKRFRFRDEAPSSSSMRLLPPEEREGEEEDGKKKMKKMGRMKKMRGRRWEEEDEGDEEDGRKKMRVRRWGGRR